MRANITFKIVSWDEEPFDEEEGRAKADPGTRKEIVCGRPGRHRQLHVRDDVH